MSQSRYQLLSLPGKLMSVERLTSADVTMIRSFEEKGELLCPTCGEPMQLIISKEGPELEHRPGSIYHRHDPDDRQSLLAKQALLRHFNIILPGPDTPGTDQSWQIAVNAPVHEARLAADVLAVSDRGARFVVEYQSYDSSLDDILTKNEQWAEAGIHPLWLLDGRRLNNLKETRVQNIMLEKLETSLLRADHPLIYLLPTNNQLLLVIPTPEASELATLGDVRLGRTPCLVRRYPLSQLGLRQGEWFLPSQYDDEAPPPPPLPRAQATRLRKLRADARLAATK